MNGDSYKYPDLARLCLLWGPSGRHSRRIQDRGPGTDVSDLLGVHHGAVTQSPDHSRVTGSELHPSVLDSQDGVRPCHAVHSPGVKPGKLS